VIIPKRPQEIHFLGPQGTFSERAAGLAAQRFEDASTIQLVAEPNFAAITDAAATRPDVVGVIPYYNLLEGLVQESVDLIYANRLSVLDAVRLPITFVAASLDGRLEHRVVASHPKALAQCSEFLRQHLPTATLQATSSTADAARLAAKGEMLALADEAAIARYGLKLAARDVANRPMGRVNFTDFLLVASVDDNASDELASGAARTLLAITPRHDHPGLLADILHQFAFYRLNIAKIHSRPAIDSVPAFVEPQMFYLEVIVPQSDHALRACLTSIRWRFGPGDAKQPDAVRMLGGWRELLPPIPQSPRDEMRLLEPTLVVGCNGGFGRLITTLLRGAGITVLGVDLHDAPSPGSTLQQYWKATAGALPPEAVEHAACVFLCIPEPAIIEAIRQLKRLDAHQLVCDVASVKSRIDLAVRDARLDCDWLSLHPMFAPSLAFAGRNVCAVPLNRHDGVRVEAALQLLRNAGAVITMLDADQHDRIAARIQAATHAALLALARTIRDEGIDPAHVLRLSTPIHGALMAMVARMSVADPSLYSELQIANPFAAEARRSLLDALCCLEREVQTGGAAMMRDWFTATRRAIGESSAWLEQAATEIAEVLAARTPAG
jgi:prephenate dehydratase/prephenate dehydrogenase